MRPTALPPLLLALWPLSAQSTTPAPTPRPPAAAASTGAGSYRLGPADVVLVTVYGEPDLSGEYPVSEQGTLEFPLVGAVVVGEQTPEEAGRALSQALGDGYLQRALVTLTVSEHASRPVQVLGAVARPGVYHLRAQSSLLGLLTEAGGVLEGAATEVHLVRSGADARVLGLEALMAGGKSGGIGLQRGDTLFVPAGQQVFVDGQVQDPGIVPFRTGLTASQALAASGGGTQSAALSRAYLLRSGQRIRVNLRGIQRGRVQDLALQPGDQLFVGESAF